MMLLKNKIYIYGLIKYTDFKLGKNELVFPVSNRIVKSVSLQRKQQKNLVYSFISVGNTQSQK